jgi:DNA-binding CsgD family transcriptional regulator/ligand-binding sensor domain-containing protein
MLPYRCLFSLILVFTFFVNALYSQIKPTGIPFIKNYERTEYDGGRQTWDIAQNDKNLLYFANNSGVLEFDGTSWTRYQVSNRSVVRSVELDNNGRLYVGAYNEFGYLEEQSNGQKKYHSIAADLPGDFKDFGEIWRIFATEDGIIFQSFTTVFFYKDGEVKVLADDQQFHFAFYINKELYISEEQKGLMKYSGQEFEQVEGGTFFNKGRKVWSMNALNSDSLLIGTQNDGLFIYHNGDITPWSTEVNDFILRNQLFQVSRISEKYFMFGSIQDGLVLSNKAGQIIQHINKEKGLQNNTILSAYTDHEGNLWLGLDNGIDYIEVSSPITYFGEGYNIEGTGYTSTIYDGKIYLGTNQALFYNEYTRENGNLKIDDDFRLVKGTKGQVWNLSKVGGELFCGHNNGAYLIDRNVARKISDVEGGWNFLKVPEHPEYILQGTYNGIVRLKRVNGKWIYDKKIKGFNNSSRIQTWDDYGNLWITHGYKGIYRLRFNEQIDSVIQTTLYNENHGLPSKLGNSVFNLDEKIYAGTEKGIYRFVFFADRFEKDTIFYEKVGTRQISELKKDPYGNFWFFYDNSRNIDIIRNSGSPKSFRHIEVLHKLENKYVPAFEHINVLDSANMIIGTVDGFAHFNPDFQTKDSADFKTHLKKFSFYCKRDTLNYYGADQLSQDSVKKIKLNNLKSIKVDFSATFYENLEHNRYSYMLEGYDNNWSSWSERTTKEYTSLSPGEYTFMIKARNVYGRESAVSQFHFEILPPWYLTHWAYIFYGLLFAGFVYLVVIFVKKRMQREKQQLIERQKEELRRHREQYELERLEMENKIMKLENEKLESDLTTQRTQVELKNKELASQAININRKNEILNYIKKELDKVNKKVNFDAQFQLNLLNRKIKEDLNLEADWEYFKQYFDEVQGDFIKRLKDQYPELSPSDLKLCAYLRMNLSTKEIAPFLKISPRGVEIHRYRLRKKLGLSRDENLVNFLLNI